MRVRPGCGGGVSASSSASSSDSLAAERASARRALAMTIVGFGASWLKAVFFADNLALNGFFLFLAKWVFDVIFLLVGQRRARR